MRCATGSPPALGHVGALRSLERTAAIRFTAGAPAVRLRGCGRPARRTTCRSCGGGARLGPRRETSDPSRCRSMRHSISSRLKASSGSTPDAQSVTKRAKSNLGAALNAIAGVGPDWLRALAPPEWHERYDRRVEDRRLPKTEPKRDASVAQVGADGFLLLDAIDGAEAPPAIAALPAVAVLRRVWARHFEREEAGPNKGETSGDEVRLQPAQGRGPGDRIESPYDSEARFRTKAGASWTGYMVHLTETCDAGAPRLVVHADTTPANVHEAMRTALIHDALATKGLAPSEHLVDAGYVSAEHLVGAREHHGIDLIGPARPDQSGQKQVEGAFQATDFVVDWERRRVRCPEGHESTTWGQTRDKASGRSLIRVGFSPAQCQPCPSRSRCTQGISRWLGLRPRPEHEALAAARARLESEAGRQLYAQRQGVESPLSQGVRAFGLRQARYRGLAKTGLQNVATAAALNLDRLTAWLAQRPLAPTRISRFAALTA